MNRIMYDGINSLAAGIARAFPHAEMVAGYVDGTYQWSADEWALFPDSVKVEISVNAHNRIGDVLDVETGDATPAEAHDWIAARKAAGLHRPTIYCSYAVVPQVRLETRELALGVDYDIWVARWDGDGAPPPMPGTPATYAAKQFSSDQLKDVSVVYDDGWPHRTAVNPPPPAQLPAPGSLSGTPWQYLNLAWSAVPGASGYWVEVQPSSGPAWTEVVPGASWHGHWQTKSFGVGPCMWRVQADGGAWSEWKQA